MKIRVILFAQLKDAAGRDEILINLPLSVLTTQELAEFICAQEAVLKPYLENGTRIAINQAFAGPADQVQEGDEVALLPPFSGG